MKLEDQVCSLELAKRLKELGVEQESQFWWIHSDWFPSEGDPYELNFKEDFPQAGRQSTDVAAFTVAELGQMLPIKFTTNRERNKGKLEYAVVSWGMHLPTKDECTYAGTEADARAKMLLYLIENKLLTPGGQSHE